MPGTLSRIYYGWYMVAGILFAGVAMTALSGGPTFAIFVDPIGRDLGLGNASFGWAQTARTVAVAASAPFLGRLLDRYGARTPMFIAAILGGLLMASVAYISAGWQMVAIFGAMGLLGLQGGSGSLYNTVPVAKWFIRRRGSVMAIVTLATPIGILLWVPLLQLAITRLGWQEAVLLMAVGGALPMAAIAMIVMRRQPEDLGLLPDGESAPDSNSPRSRRSADPVEHPWTRREALRAPAFWVLTVVFGLMMFSTSTVVVFRTPHFVELGFDPQLVAFALTTEAMPALFMGIVLGVALDRLSYRYVVSAGLLLLAASVFAAIVASSPWHMFLSYVLFGFGIIMTVVTQNVIWPSFFGRAHVGSIRGIAMPLTLALGSAGAPLAGIAKDVTGEFLPAWWVAIAGLLVATVLMAAVQKPTPRPSLAASRRRSVS